MKTVVTNPYNPNIPPRGLDGMYSTKRNIPNFVYKPMSCKYNWNVFPFCCGLLFVLVCVAWIGANSVPIGNPYPSMTVTCRIPYGSSKCKYYTMPSLYGLPIEFTGGERETRSLEIKRSEWITFCRLESPRISWFSMVANFAPLSAPPSSPHPNGVGFSPRKHRPYANNHPSL